ncbi:hypothetical protein ACQ7EN_08010 [Leuconostoc lactis]|uniref:hypothetical protein n=1 Tax=Leuconostoc lactis TaxID=1246 RepID=UPI003D6B9FF9
MYKILKQFKGYAEDHLFEIGDTHDFSDERASEITTKLGAGFLEKLEEVITSEDDNAPTETNTVAEIKAYLADKQIDFDDKATKADLLSLVK